MSTVDKPTYKLSLPSQPSPCIDRWNMLRVKGNGYKMENNILSWGVHSSLALFSESILFKMDLLSFHTINN